MKPPETIPEETADTGSSALDDPVELLADVTLLLGHLSPSLRTGFALPPSLAGGRPPGQHLRRGESESEGDRAASAALHRVLDRLRLASAEKEREGGVAALLVTLGAALEAEKARFRAVRAALVASRRGEYEASLAAVLAAEHARYAAALASIDRALAGRPDPQLSRRRVLEGGMHLAAVGHECRAARVRYQTLLELDFALAAQAHVGVLERLRREYEDGVGRLRTGYERATRGLGVRRSSWG
ncbi:hypothetical protein Q8F55_004907 [Vanrija albida]|uniref:Sorting nexin/Vps5-like C-terminal domain-containing protein n=1 Tax=Vanrija albida TaxID=181172 RepID=A0ABR3Q079_9TREE